MKMTVAFAVALALSVVPLLAQEPKPVPKDSLRVSVPGCAKGYVFTVARRTADQPGTANLPEGMHLRMNGPKKLMNAIKQHGGAMIEITGLIKKNDLEPQGMTIGGVRIMPGSRSAGSSVSTSSVGSEQAQIDVEGWRPGVGDCPRK